MPAQIWKSCPALNTRAPFSRRPQARAHPFRTLGMLPTYPLGPSKAPNPAPPIPHTPFPVLLHAPLCCERPPGNGAAPTGLFPHHAQLPPARRWVIISLSIACSSSTGSPSSLNTAHTKPGLSCPNPPPAPPLAPQLLTPSLTFLLAQLRPSGHSKPPLHLPAQHICPHSSAHPICFSHTTVVCPFYLQAGLLSSSLPALTVGSACRSLLLTCPLSKAFCVGNLVHA